MTKRLQRKIERLEDRRMLATDLDPVVERIIDIRDNFGEQVEIGTNGDFDRNGLVDFKDFLLVANDLQTFDIPVKWTIPDQRSNPINQILQNGIAELSISVTNKHGTFEETCEVLLGDLRTGEGRCKIVVDTTNLLDTDNPWSVKMGFKRQNISLSPRVTIATVTIEKLIDPAKLLAVKNTRVVKFVVTDFRGISVRALPLLSP